MIIKPSTRAIPTNKLIRFASPVGRFAAGYLLD
jgi:hypothetical protein